MTAPTGSPTEKTRDRRPVVVGVVVAVAVLVVLGVLSVTGRQAPASPPGGSAAGPTDPVAAARLVAPRRQADDPLARGAVDAPVVLAEWGDFQCIFCRQYAQRTEPDLVRQYVDTGRVRMEWHDYAYLGPESVLGARAARAAGRQNRFWAFHDALYAAQPRENSGAVTDASLTATAARLGLDVARFQRDYADPAIARAVADDQQAGTRLGVNGTPSFVVGDQLIFGAQPAATFQQAIDGALRR